MLNTYTFTFYNLPIGLIQDITSLLETFSKEILAVRAFDILDYTYMALTQDEIATKQYVNLQIDVNLLEVVNGNTLSDYLTEVVKEQRNKMKELNKLYAIKETKDDKCS